jgi:hypothetical protein
MGVDRRYTVGPIGGIAVTDVEGRHREESPYLPGGDEGREAIRQTGNVDAIVNTLKGNRRALAEQRRGTRSQNEMPRPTPLIKYNGTEM